MAEITDLDVLAGPDRKVKLAGKMYVLPGDIPVELFLRIAGYEKRLDEGTDEAELILELNDAVLELFNVVPLQRKTAAVKSLPIGLRQLVQAVGVIYRGAGDVAAADPPPVGKRNGTASTRKARAASAS
jgi:hypothetical protein